MLLSSNSWTALHLAHAACKRIAQETAQSSQSDPRMCLRQISRSLFRAYTTKRQEISEPDLALFPRTISEEVQLLMDAIKRRDINYIKQHCNESNVNSTDEEGSSLLHLATENKFIAIFGILYERGANFNLQDKDGNTPLHRAAKNGNSIASMRLMSYGADKNIQNNLQKTPLEWAEIHNKDSAAGAIQYFHILLPSYEKQLRLCSSRRS